MYLILESFFIGIYSCLLYLLIEPFIPDFTTLLLVCGFIKHLLGAIIRTWYCNNGYACSKILDKTVHYVSYIPNIVGESILEAFAFLLVGTILSKIMKSKTIYLFFVMGIVLHIFSEIVGLHTYVCKTSCFHNHNMFFAKKS
jgi:hypothetical protein